LLNDNSAPVPNVTDAWTTGSSGQSPSNSALMAVLPEASRPPTKGRLQSVARYRVLVLEPVLEPVPVEPVLVLEPGVVAVGLAVALLTGVVAVGLAVALSTGAGVVGVAVALAVCLAGDPHAAAKAATARTLQMVPLRARAWIGPFALP